MITTIKVQEMKNGAKFIYLPNELGDQLKKGRKYIINIRVIELVENLTQYKCLVCEHRFDLRIGEDVYCPGCDNEDKKAFIMINM